MLEIKPIQTKEEQRDICQLCGVGFDPDCLAYGAKENGKLLGVAQFRILGEYAVVYDLANAVGVYDTEALVITEKATLNFIDLCGIKEVILKNGNRINLEGYFESPCQKNKRR